MLEQSYNFNIVRKEDVQLYLIIIACIIFGFIIGFYLGFQSGHSVGWQDATKVMFNGTANTIFPTTGIPYS